MKTVQTLRKKLKLFFSRGDSTPWDVVFRLFWFILSVFLFTEAMIQAHTLIQVICVYIDLIHLFIKKIS